MVRLHVGQASVASNWAKYADSFDLVELNLDGTVPKKETLRGYRRSVGPAFTFSVVLPREVAALGRGAAVDRRFAEALEVATTVEARCILLSTPADVRPTAANKDRIAALAEKLPRPSVVLAWEPLGLWEREDILSLSKRAGLLPVFDGTRARLSAGGVTYTRIRALGGNGQRVPDAALAKLATQLRNRREAFVVVEARHAAKRVKERLIAHTLEASSKEAIVVRPTPGKLRAEDEEQ